MPCFKLSVYYQGLICSLFYIAAITLAIILPNLISMKIDRFNLHSKYYGFNFVVPEIVTNVQVFLLTKEPIAILHYTAK